jgi:hypothetical protein
MCETPIMAKVSIAMTCVELVIGRTNFESKDTNDSTRCRNILHGIPADSNRIPALFMIPNNARQLNDCLMVRGKPAKWVNE